MSNRTRLAALRAELSNLSVGRSDSQREAFRLAVAARSAAIAAAPAVAAEPAAPRPSLRADRAWTPCGYPGCSPHYCDDCGGR